MVLLNIKYCIGYLGIFLSLLISCSDNSAGPGNNEPDDEFLGIYLLEGYQVNLEICYVGQNCEGGEVLSRDTVQTSFTVEIELVNNRPDTLLFSNLEGADVGINHPNYNGHAADPNCTSATSCAFARLQNDSLKFNIESQPGYYYGTGILKNNELALKTHFRHRGAGVDYVLSGTKQED